MLLRRRSLDPVRRAGRNDRWDSEAAPTVAVTRDGRYAVVGTAQGRVEATDLNLETLISRACTLAGRPLEAGDLDGIQMTAQRLGQVCR